MADIILVCPKTGQDTKHVDLHFPISIVSIAGPLIKEGYVVKVIDQRLDENWNNNLRIELKKNPYCVGLTTMIGKQIKNALEISEFVKKHSKAVVVWGGYHPTLYPEQTLEHPLVDVVIKGEGEISFLEVVKKLENNESLENIKGISYKRKNKIINNKEREFIDLNSLPKFPFQLVKVKDYFINKGIIKDELLIFSSRGCQFNCSFCYNKKFNENKWRGMSAEKVLNILKKIKELGAKSVRIADENFFTDKKRVKDICDLMIREKINLKISTTITAKELSDFNKEFLEKLSKAGFETLYVGVESGCERIQRVLKKEVDVNKLLATNKRLKRTRIKPRYLFMTGVPSETKDEFKRTISLIKKLKKDNDDATNALVMFTPYPGTEIYNKIKKTIKEPESLEEWSKSSWDGTNTPWLDQSLKKYMLKTRHFLYFLDDNYKYQNNKNNIIYNLYSKIARLRCRLNFYGLSPEVRTR